MHRLLSSRPTPGRALSARGVACAVIGVFYGLACGPAAGAHQRAGDVVIAQRPVKVCQLVGEFDRERGTPTLNRTESRCRLFGTDLGVPFSHKGHTYFLFGDTVGAGPKDADVLAYTTDASPGKGLHLTFPVDEGGTYRPLRIPGISQGAFEVPMEGVSAGGRMVVYQTTDHTAQRMMGRSVVAVSRDDGATFRTLYDLSTRHFINVSVVKAGPKAPPGLPARAGLLLFGSGDYRKSDVRLAAQPEGNIERRESLRYFAGPDAAGHPRWSSREEDAQPLFDHPCVGELSASYNRFLRRWVLLYNADAPRGIVMRTADFPWGPWSEAQVLFAPWEHGGYGHFMHVSWNFRKCDEVHDPGREKEWGGEYGPYQLEDLAEGREGETTLFFTLSTWNPYTVVLMQTVLRQGTRS